MKRRDFLRNVGIGAVGVSAGVPLPYNPFAYAQAADSPFANMLKDPVLVVIYLRGGMDQLNTVIPYNDKTYYKIRPTIGIPKEASIKLDSQWAIHPAMASLKEWYDNGRFGVVINSGSPHPTRSHFDAQDFMEYAAPGNRGVSNGWLNRYLQAVANPRGEDPSKLRAIALQERLPPSLRGEYPVVAMPPNLRDINEVLDLFEGFYGGEGAAKGESEDFSFLFEQAFSKKEKETSAAAKRLRPWKKDPAVTGVAADPVMRSGQITIDYLRRLRQIIYGDAENVYGSNRVPDYETQVFQEYPQSWFASRMKMLARVIKADVGLKVATSDINGWDHHVGLGSLDGTLNRMVTFLSEALSAFMTDLGPDLDRTVIMVQTEFGRVAAENGNDGSDHGHGGPCWLMGGKFKGGRIYGKWTGLEPSALFEKRDQPVTTDFREICAEVLRKHMGMDELPKDFFPGNDPTDPPYTPLEKGLGMFA